MKKKICAGLSILTLSMFLMSCKSDNAVNNVQVVDLDNKDMKVASEVIVYQENNVKKQREILHTNVSDEIDPITGMIFINDYNANDKDYHIASDFISPIENRIYGQTYTLQYYSRQLGRPQDIDVILPPFYDANKKYPVLYMTHGLGGHNKAWSDMGVKYIVQNSLYENNTPEMIIVCCSCYIENDSESNHSWNEIVPSYNKFEYELINDIMPFINTNFPTLTGRDNTAIAGYSLGGKLAIGIGFKYQDEFGYIGAFSSAGGVIPSSPMNTKNIMINDFVIDEKYEDFPLLFLNVGISDGVCGKSSTVYSQNFADRGIKHIYYQMEGDHEGSVWQNGLYNFVKRIF